MRSPRMRGVALASVAASHMETTRDCHELSMHLTMQVKLWCDMGRTHGGVYHHTSCLLLDEFSFLLLVILSYYKT